MKPARKGVGWRTAISRPKLAAPYRWLFDNELSDFESRDKSVLDYGCGRGQDADRLEISKFDPNWFPEHPLANPLLDSTYDFIFCHYVLNVIPDPAERDFVVGEIRRLLADLGRAFVSIRTDTAIDKSDTQFRVESSAFENIKVIERNPKFEIWELI